MAEVYAKRSRPARRAEPKCMNLASPRTERERESTWTLHAVKPYIMKVVAVFTNINESAINESAQSELWLKLTPVLNRHSAPRTRVMSVSANLWSALRHFHFVMVDRDSRHWRGRHARCGAEARPQ
jgi:hypothetical protein